MDNNVWSARANNNQGSVSQGRSVYMDILRLIVIQALRAAVTSEYKAIAAKSRPASTTAQYDPTWPEENDRFKTVTPEYAARITSTTPSVVLRPPQSFAVTVPSRGNSDSQGRPPSHDGSISGSSTLTPLAESAHTTASESGTNGVEVTSEKPVYPCPGNCVPSFLTWFCDATNSNYECSSGRVCCMPTTTTTPPEDVVRECPGTCIPPAISGLCKKPARLILRTTTCDRDSICCSETPRLW
ncbi:uncharacterized protein LOC119392786 [Rhipicephalus sanguineus]|uniref:uncharacterized protein LOC119392786 n=1 Tax=Rhipicephalus sanguineus TaxID=34632 RepID=UPI00189586A9|nr:uncharacterized protein LOC119392786 [Rhipicephalus sanguineus]